MTPKQITMAKPEAVPLPLKNDAIPLRQMSVDQTLLIRHLSEKFDSACELTPVSGGDINTCFLFKCAQQEYFVKSNKATCSAAMFHAETESLLHLGAQSAIRVPNPIVQGDVDGIYYLVLEAMHLSESGDWEALGRGLANLHRHQSRYYGWQDDNFIGRNHQYNQKHSCWSDFWWECRLRPQLNLACESDHRVTLEPLIEPLHDASRSVLAEHRPEASLLHGDLWRGNVGFGRRGEPVIFDPASYYGDRETDLALTCLFGGFPVSFYNAYTTAWPLPPGNEDRLHLYNLYHLLNHLNLFGGGYLSRCLSVIRKITATAQKISP